MDRIYSEIYPEDDHTIKRRISSILKAPRSPLRDLGNGNEPIQGCEVEKRQRNSRRVSFAETIRVFPTDLQTNAESDPLEETAGARHQEPINQKEKLDITQCEITGMNTLLHAPIQTPLQEIECHNINSGLEWNKMDRTLLFSEQNEMDMTAGHTVMITHDVGVYEETKPKNSFLGGPIKGQETSLLQQKINAGSTEKIKFDDFLKSLKSAKPFPTPAGEISFFPSEVPEKKLCFSEVNASHHLQGKSNIMNAFGELNNKAAVTPHCIFNEKTIAPPTVNNGEADVSGKHGVKLISNDGSRHPNQGISVTQQFFGPAPVLDGNKNTVSSSISSVMEMTRNCTGFTCDANSKVISKPVHRTCEKQSKTVSRLMERTVFGDSNMDITENQASTDANLNGIPHFIPYNKMTASKQEALYGNKELQNLSIKSVPWTSSHLERKEDALLVSLLSDKSGLFSAKGIDLSKNYVAKSEVKQGECQFFLSDDKAVFSKLSGTTAVNDKTHRKSGCSNIRVRPVSADKTVMFTSSEDMELTKPTAYLMDKSLKTAGFYKKSQEETRPGNHNIIGPVTDKTVVFSLDEDNEMEITKSCTVPVNHNFIQHCERDPQVLPLQPVDKTVACASHNDMGMTKPHTCIIDQYLENDGAQALHKIDYETDRRPPIGSARNKTLDDENEMEITRSHTVALNYGDAPQFTNIPTAMYVPPDKTVKFACSEDMEITRPLAGAIDKSLKSITDPLAVSQQGPETGNKRIMGIASDKTVVFSLGEDNEMEFTKSCTVAVNHNFMQHYETVPQVLPLKPVDKAVYASHNDMDRSKPISCIIDQSLENAGAHAVHKLDKEADGRTPTGSTRDKSVEFSLVKDNNNMEITRSHTVAVNHDIIQQIGGACQASSLFPPADDNNMAVNKHINFIPADKIMMLSHHNNIEITKPIEHVIDSSQKNKEKEMDKVILPSFVKEETVKFFLHEDKEMDITKSLTVVVNHDIQQMERASQELSLIPAEKTKVSGHNSSMATSVVPADKTLMWMHSNDMEITEPLTDTSLKNTNCRVLPPKGKEPNKAMLSGPVKGNSITVKLHDNEMEIIKCDTVKVSHDIFSQHERRPPVQFYQDCMDTTGSHNDMKNMHANIMKMEKESKWEVSSDQTVALATVDNMESAKRHTMLMNNKTIQHHQSVSKDGLIIPLNKNSMFTCYQNGKEINKLPPNATADQNLEEKHELNKNTNQQLSNMSLFTSHGITDDIDITRNHTLNIYGPDCYGPNPEKHIQHSVTKSRQKTIAFSDGETMEMTKNHTIGIEFMNTNNYNNEHSSCSQTASGSEVPPLVVPNKKVLGITKTYKHMPQKSISSSNMELSVSVKNVNTQNLLRMQDNQLETHTSRNNNFAEVAANYVHCHEENECMFPVEMVVQNPELCGDTTLNLNIERMCMLLTESETSKDYPEKLYLSRHEGNPTGVMEGLPVANTATKIDLGHVTKDWQTDLDLPINNLCSEDPLLLSKPPSIVNDCLKLTHPGKKPEFGLISQNGRSSLGEELMKPKGHLELTEEIGIESSNYIDSSELKNKCLKEGDSFPEPFNTMQKDNCQIKKLPLGIFPPKLPNKRKRAHVEDTGIRTRPQDLENSLLVKKSSDKITQYLSPSHYISEELLPPCVGEMNSNEFLNSDLQEVSDVMNEKEITTNEGCLRETNKQKRVWDQEGELQKEKKLKVDEGCDDTTELKQPYSIMKVPNEETLEGKITQDMVASNMERTHGSNGSSLDSKADSDLSIQRHAEIEAELLMDSICEQNLQEKLQEGVITVGEFFTLLQVHILIQKPRQSLLPPKYTVNAPPTAEDLILSEYVYHPKLQIYKEDCQALSETIEELKLCADNKDKLLANVHKSLWEVMRTCSDEELKQFGAELNKIKSRLAKKTKVLAHRGKAKLYMKLVQNAQFQWEKLQSRLNEMDELFKEMDNCRVTLEAEIAKLAGSELEVSQSVAKYESKVRQTEQELENYKAQEEALQRDQSNLRGQQQQRVSEIRHLQEEAESCQEHMEKYNFSEWVMKEWNDQQAVFTFLCDSIELIVALECPIDVAAFTTRKLDRKIIGLHFESLLDEAKAPTSSKLVHKLIFQCIDQCTWQEKYSTVQQLDQLLHDISLVVSHCQLLGEEIVFLNRWGGKFNLLKTAVNDTKVKLLFSSSLVFAKFEVELSLSANYPTSPMAFTVQKYTGNLGQEEISEVLTRVPVGANYLKRIVSQIHHSLLQNPSIIHRQ
ncbi:outer kinetochore KNL1 complex subunit KNL1 [Paroedura picta]|uniref:outer kinetochore KNL1 complex subunit KNL1 n=1 Tax=Paroedura picta TaxID=143630 RepID=UPI00405698C1